MTSDRRTTLLTLLAILVLWEIVGELDLVASGALPVVPLQGIDAFKVDVIPPPPPPPPAPTRTQPEASNHTANVAPVEPHEGIQPEAEPAPAPPCAECVVGSTGDFTGVGVIGSLAVAFGRSVLFPEGVGHPDLTAAFIAVAAFLLLSFSRLDVLWVIAGGAAAGLVFGFA